MVTAALDPQYFVPLLDSVRYAPDMDTALIHGDGDIFMLMPDREGVIGKNVAQPGAFLPSIGKAPERPACSPVRHTPPAISA
ncbi:MAG: hypothetical protein HC889_07365 [Synechococcaceae cyanobacterium SM1_2_3]|nr:hypothetical protein [Synechococcaceae cyanobacterium SM1_2_3]